MRPQGDAPSRFSVALCRVPRFNVRMSGASDTIAPDDPLGAACELVGRFLYHFAAVERRIDAAVAKLFELTDDAADTLTANIDFNRKINLIETMVNLQAPDKAPEWQKNATNLLKAIKGKNDPYRQIVAHSSFEPAENNSVRFKRTVAKGKLQRNEPVWTKTMFDNHFADMDKYALQLDDLIADLQPFRGPTYFFLGF
jgi:hypothetical protein